MTKDKNKNDHPKRGDIYWIELDPTLGTEIKKTRPCAVLSINPYNKKMPRVIVLPITSQVQTVYPFQVLISINGREGKVMTDQIRAVDKSRLKGKLGDLSLDAIRAIENSLKLCLGIS